MRVDEQKPDVVPFPGPGGKRQVSAQGAFFGFWYGRHGIADEGIAYVNASDTKFNLVPVTVKGDTLEFGQARVLFGGRSFNDANGGSFSSDWKRTLVSLSAGGDTSSSLVMVSNWPAELKQVNFKFFSRRGF